MKKLASGDWQAAWAEAVRTAPAGKLTGKHVASVVDARLARKHAAESPVARRGHHAATAIAHRETHPACDIHHAIPRAYPAEFVRTVPAPGIPLPGWKPEWAQVMREAPRPLSSIRSGVFGWQPPD